MITSREDRLHCLVGQAAARQFGLAPGSQIDLRAGERSVSLTVSGIITSGGAEIVKLSRARYRPESCGLPGRVSLVQLSVSGTP